MHDGGVRIERDRTAAGERHVPDAPQRGARREPQRLELAHRLARKAAGTGLRADLRVLLQHQDLAPGLGEHLRGSETRGSGAQNQVLNVFHASSLRIPSTAAARSAVEGFRASLHWRSRLRPRR